jgi:uncharacterized Zn-binding protein involved in type VI secretion
LWHFLGLFVDALDAMKMKGGVVASLCHVAIGVGPSAQPEGLARRVAVGLQPFSFLSCGSTAVGSSTRSAGSVTADVEAVGLPTQQCGGGQGCCVEGSHGGARAEVDEHKRDGGCAAAVFGSRICQLLQLPVLGSGAAAARWWHGGGSGGRRGTTFSLRAPPSSLRRATRLASADPVQPWPDLAPVVAIAHGSGPGGEAWRWVAGVQAWCG